MYQNFIIPYLYEAQDVSGDTPPIIRSLKLYWQPLVCHTWKVVGRLVGGRVRHLVGGSRDRSPVTGDFFPGHQTVPCALGSTQPLKMSTRIFLGIKTAGA